MNDDQELVAPARFRGMTCSTPRTLRDERRRWIAACFRAGHTQRQIACALGIHQSNVSAALKIEGVDRSERGRGR